MAILVKNVITVKETVTVSAITSLALVFAFICMQMKELRANFMCKDTIDSGIIIDIAIVIVEGLFISLGRCFIRIQREINLLGKVDLATEARKTVRLE